MTIGAISNRIETVAQLSIERVELFTNHWIPETLRAGKPINNHGRYRNPQKRYIELDVRFINRGVCCQILRLPACQITGPVPVRPHVKSARLRARKPWSA